MTSSSGTAIFGAGCFCYTEAVFGMLKGIKKECPAMRGEALITLRIEKFFEAEDCHHSYYQQNKDAPYCQIVINPKLKTAQETSAALLNF